MLSGANCFESVSDSPTSVNGAVCIVVTLLESV